MTMHRYQARADLVPGGEHGVGGRPIQFVTLTLTDAGRMDERIADIRQPTVRTAGPRPTCLRTAPCSPRCRAAPRP